MGAPDPTGRFRSIVSDGAEIVMFDPRTNAIDLRMAAGGQIPQDLNFFSNEALLSKVNLSLIRGEAKRLSFNIIEDSAGGVFTLDLPAYLFPQNNGETRVSTRAVFDTSKELLHHTEVVTIMEDGTRVTSSSYPAYQEHNGTYIKTGMVHITENKNPNRVQGVKNAKIYNSPDDYPTMSKAEYEKLAKEGLAFPAGEMFFGDPADLSYTETIIEIYRNVEINTVQNSAFRVLGGF